MSFDRVKNELVDFIWAVVGRRLRYAYVYGGQVIAQDGATKQLDVLLDDPRMRGSGADRIVIRHGMPGVVATVTPGQRVTVAFDGGDPDKPFIIAFDQGRNNLTKLEIGNEGGSKEPAARETDPIVAGELYQQEVGTSTQLYFRTPPASGGAWAPVVTGAIAPVPATVGTSLSGTITAGSSVVDIED